MQVKNPEVMQLVKAIAEHYSKNVANHYVSRVISAINIDPDTHVNLVELTERYENYSQQGYYLEELYSQILAIARLAHMMRTQILPNIRSLVNGGLSSDRSAPDRVLRDMAITNFEPNLKILEELVNKLFQQVASFDRLDAKGHIPVYAGYPELTRLGLQLPN